jgi:hypothetical protein
MPSIRRRTGATVEDGPGGAETDLLAAPVGMDDDLSHALASGPPRRTMPGATAFLTATVLVAGGFLGGVITQKHQGTSSSNGTNAAALAAFRNRAGTGARTGTNAGTSTGTSTGAATGTGPTGGAAGGVTIGTVKLVDGNKIYLTATDGSTIVVTTGDDTTIKVTKNGKASDLAPGSTVVVQGTAGSDGVVAATTVTQGGTSGGFGGFGGGGFGGGRSRTGTGTGTGKGGPAAGGGAGG